MRAIDVHVHPGTKEFLVDAGGPFAEDALRTFRQPLEIRTPDQMAAEYAALDVLGVLLAWDARTATGRPAVTNDYVAEIVRRHPARFVGFAGVDPHAGRDAVREVERAVRDLGLRGLKLHPIAQAFLPDNPSLRPLWEKCCELRIPVLFHLGHTAFGGGAPGGRGLKLEYARPIHVDGIAADFPELTIIGAHAGWPWHEELLSIALHKTNVWIDLSGWLPKYLPEPVVRYANSLLQDRCLFGSDYPFLTPGRWLDDFEKATFKPEVRAKILLENARRLLRLP